MEKGYDNAPEWISQVNLKAVKVAFGNSHAKQVLDPTLVGKIDSKLSAILGKRRSLSGFPGCLAVSILLKDFDIVRRNPYSILLKSDGVRYWLFAFQNTDSEGNVKSVVDMINRSFTHHMVVAAFRNSVFLGSIFDGELVMCEEEYTFQVFDCIAFAGRTRVFSPQSFFAQ